MTTGCRPATRCKSTNLLEGFTPQPPTLTPPNFLDFSKSLENSKSFQIINNTRNIANMILVLRSCGDKTFKIQVEWLRGVGA
jgi:hypothetical protein